MSETTPDNDTGDTSGRPRHNIPVFGVPASAFRRFDAKVLSPDDATLRGDERPPHPTVYRPDRLILPGGEHRRHVPALDRLVATHERAAVHEDDERNGRCSPVGHPDVEHLR